MWKACALTCHERDILLSFRFLMRFMLDTRDSWLDGVHAITARGADALHQESFTIENNTLRALPVSKRKHQYSVSSVCNNYSSFAHKCRPFASVWLDSMTNTNASRLASTVWISSTTGKTSSSSASLLPCSPTSPDLKKRLSLRSPWTRCFSRSSFVFE